MAKITKIGSSNCYKTLIEGTPPNVTMHVEKDVEVRDAEDNLLYTHDVHKPVQEKYELKDLLIIMINKVNELVDKANE